MILHEMIIQEIRKNNLRLRGVNNQFLIIHPDRLRKILNENNYLTLLAQEKEDELQQMADGARKERQASEKSRAKILSTQKAEAKKVRLAQIQLENEDKQIALELERKEIEEIKEKLKAQKESAGLAATKAKEISSSQPAKTTAKKKTSGKKK